VHKSCSLALTHSVLASQLHRDGTNGSSGSNGGSMVFPDHSRNNSPHGTFTLPPSSMSRHSISALLLLFSRKRHHCLPSQ